jgi:cytochrome c-type biogenesis protein CcmE
VDLSPRTTTLPAGDEAPARRPGRKKGPIIVLALVLVVGAIVVGKFLTSAIDYYCNVDEVGVAEKCSGDRRVRVQGTVDQGSLVLGDSEFVERFTITFNGSDLPVDYAGGEPLPDLFQECIPVVVAGRLRDGVLVGDAVEVKHSNEYQEANPDRLEQAESAACSQPA